MSECDKLHGEYVIDHELEQMKEIVKHNIKELFEAASQAILEESINDIEFKLYKDTIIITIEYLEAKRHKKMTPSKEW